MSYSAAVTNTYKIKNGWSGDEKKKMVGIGHKPVSSPLPRPVPHTSLSKLCSKGKEQEKQEEKEAPIRIR